MNWPLAVPRMHVVNLVYPGQVLPMDGFGYLVPGTEKEDILGVVFDSCVFPTKVADCLRICFIQDTDLNTSGNRPYSTDCDAWREPLSRSAPRSSCMQKKLAVPILIHYLLCGCSSVTTSWPPLPLLRCKDISVSYKPHTATSQLGKTGCRCTQSDIKVDDPNMLLKMWPTVLLDRVADIHRELAASVLDKKVHLTGPCFGFGIGVNDCIRGARAAALKITEKSL